ncbi:MAG: phage tail tape measure protein, partial [Casimicrobium sp.]
MSDVVGKYKVELDYDAASATVSLREFRSKAIADVKSIGDALGKIDVLKGLQNDAKAASERITELGRRADELRRIVANTNKDDTGYKLLVRALKDADKEFNAAVRSANNLDSKIGKLSNALVQAGVDTKALASEEIRLAESLQKAAAAAEINNARGILGVKSLAEQRAEVQRLQQAYETLRRSGASVQELAEAKIALRLRTQELAQSQVGVTNNMQQLGIAIAGVLGSTLAYTRAAREVIASASRYEQGLASVASITQLNKVQLDVLGQSVLRLSAQIGIELPTAFKALYNIIGSGIPPENAISVLEASAKAAVAGLTTIDNAARIGVQVLNAYQLQAGQLPKVFDILFQTVKDGVISFEELADKFGLVLPAARTAGVTLEELSGAVVVLTRSGLPASRAMVALEGAIKQLAAPTPEAAAEMARLGITFNGLVGTIEQLVKLNVGPGTLRKLIPDVEGQRAVALFTQNYDLLRESVQEAGKAAGATQDAFNKLKNTPEQQLKIFNAELERSKVALGKALLEGALPLLQGLTALLKSFNELSPTTKNVGAVIASLAGALTVGAVASRALSPILAPLAAGLAATGTAGAAGALGVNALRLAVTGLVPAVAAAGTGFALGEKLRESSAEAQRFGDFLGGSLAATVIQVGNKFDQLKAFVG